MAYNPHDDVEHWVLESGGLAVSLKSYKGGAKKFALERPNSRYNKLGRLTLEEAKQMHELLGTAIAKFDQGPPLAAVKEEEKPKEKPRKKRRALASLGNYGGNKD